MQKKYIFLIISAFFCLSACKSSKQTVPETPLRYDEYAPQTEITGVLEQGTNGTFSMTTGSGKSIVSWFLVSSEEAPEVYEQLSNYTGKKVTIDGTIIEQRSNWNFTVAVTDILKADD